MQAGKLRKRLTYRTPNDSTPDSYGQTIAPATAYTTVGTYWGEIRSPNGRELANAAQIKAVVSHVVTIRYQGSLPSPKGEFLYQTRIFQIASVVNVDERNRRVDLLCTELVSPNS
ncbi:MAG: hypothetical protein NVSMB9_28580 [Isosphaeraceae bacterium]